MKKKLLSVLLIMTMVLSCAFTFAGCGEKEDADANAVSGEAIELSICHIASESDPIHEGWVKLKELLEEKSDGRFAVTIYGNKSIANSDIEAAEKVQQNIVQMTSTPAYAPASLGNIEGYKVFDYPYLFETNDEIYGFLESDLYGEWAKSLEAATGVRPMGGYSIGWLAIGATKKELTSVDSLKGLKIRTMSNDVQMGTISALGGSPTPVNYGELYTACQQGTVDGLMTSTGLCVSDRFYEVCKHFIAPEAAANVHIPLINAEWYDALPDDMKAIFDECFAEYLEYERGLQVEFNNSALDTMEENGCTVTKLSDAEKQEWKAALEKVYTDYPDAAGVGVAAQVKEILNK